MTGAWTPCGNIKSLLLLLLLLLTKKLKLARETSDLEAGTDEGPKKLDIGRVA